VILLDGEYEFNSRIIVFAILGIILLIAIFFPYSSFDKPKIIDPTNLTLSDKDKVVIYSKLTPEERIKVANYIMTTPTPVIQMVYVTPTPDNGYYYVSEYESGIRKLQRPFSFSRKDVSGLKDLTAHVTVYDYRIMDSYNWFNPADYKYYEQKPLDNNNKFLFVFIQFYIDDISGDGVKFWLPKDNSFAVQIDETLYQPIEFEKQIRIHELEEIYNFNDDNRITAYNSIRMYSHSTEKTKTAGEYSQNIDVLQPGKSNAIDGYLLFEVPNHISVDNTKILGTFYAFGESQWVLKI
jgi:hypothetical protein